MPSLNLIMTRKIILPVLFICFSILYNGYIRQDPLLDRDDLSLINPIRSVQSIGGYIEGVSTNEILDMQPFRDLTFYINIKIQDYFSFSTFHLFNLIIFFYSIYLFSELLAVLLFSEVSIIGATLIYASNPIMITSVGWVSSRKHSLALVFILLAIIQLVQKKSITWKCTVFYFLSILSHQIFFLFPIWVYLYSKLKTLKINRRNLTIMAIIGFSIVALSSYKTFYLRMNNTYYLDSDFFSNVSRYVLSIGRSVTLITFPYSIAGVYYEGSIWNIIGLPLLVLISFVFYKSKSRNQIMCWMSLAVLAHLPTYIAFVNDTYLYLPLLCTIISLGILFTGLENKKHVSLLSISTITVIVLLSIKTISASQMWRNIEKLWSYSYLNEPSPYSAIIASGYIKDKKASLNLLRWGAKNFDFSKNYDLLVYFLGNVYTAPITPQEKIEIYEDCLFENRLYLAYYGMALIEGNSEQTQKGIGILKNSLLFSEDYLPNQQRTTIINSLAYVCKKIPGKEFVCQELNIKYQDEIK